jgi:tape measure domain-containing protein
VTSFGWADTITVGIETDASQVEGQFQRAVAEAMREVSRTAERAAASVERSFTDAARDSRTAMNKVGSPATFAGIQRAAHSAAQGVEHAFQRASAGAERALSSLRNGLKRGAAAAAISLGLIAGAAVKMGVSTLASLEQSEIAFTELLGSAQEADKFLRRLARFAATTPFELQGLVDATRGLIGAGLSADKAMVAMEALGNASAALGLNQERFGRVMLATTQIMNKGKVSAEELLQMNEAGLPVQKLLAKALGITTAELLKQGEAGKLQADVVLPKLWEQMQKDYGGSMAKQSQTLSGLWSTFMDTIRIGMAQVLEPFAGLMRGALKTATETFGGAFERLPGMIQGTLDRLDPNTNLVTATMKGWAQAIIVGIGAGFRTGDWGPFTALLRNMLTIAVEQAAAVTAQPVIDGLAKGLRTGDWGDFGKALGERAASVPLALLEGLSNVRWTEVGKQAAIIAVPFVIGFMGGLVDGLIKAFSEDFWGTLLQIIMIIPLGRAAGLLLRAVPLLAKIPLLGGFLRLFEGVGKALEAPLRGLFGRIGPGIVEGISKVFPRVGAFLEGGLTGLAGRIGARAATFRERGGQLITGLAAGVAEQFALVVRNIAQVIRLLLSPFVGIGRWLISRGRELLEGLGVGIRALWGSIGDWMARTRSRLTSPFSSAGRWLYDAGKNIVEGIRRGIDAGIGEVGGVLGRLKDAIVNGLKRLFGIRSPSTVMAGIGTNLVAGLVKGLVTNFSSLRTIVKGIGGNVVDWLGGIPSLFGKIFGFLGGGGGTARGLVGFAANAFGFWRSMFPGMTIGGWRATGSVPGSDHPKGKALDLMTTSSQVATQIISNFVTQPGAKYWIWNRQIAQASGGWRPHYYSGPSPHTDHVHLSYYDRGGWLLPGMLGANTTGRPERVLDPDESREWAAGRRGGVVVHQQVLISPSEAQVPALAQAMAQVARREAQTVVADYERSRRRGARA